MSTQSAAARPVRRRPFADLSVSVKILSAVGLGAFVAIVVAATGMVGLGRTSATADLISKRSVAAVASVGQLRTAVAQADATIANSALAPSDAASEYFNDAFDKSVTSFDEALAAYRASNPAGSTQTIADLQKNWQSYTAIAKDKLRPLGNDNKLDQWSAVRTDQVQPLLEKITTELDELAESEAADAVTNATAAQDTYRTSRTIVWTVLVVGLLLALGMAVLLARSIVQSLNKVKAVCEALAVNDLTRTTGLTSADEPGQMGRALDAAIVALRQTVATIDESASSLAAASEQMTGTAAQIAASAEATSTQSEAVSAVAATISRSVDTVSAGAEEMGASIREISQNAAEAAQVAGEAVALASRTSATMNKLGESSSQIGNVIKTITAIAEQTNLLALNATIEAARAGEMGKGFAVVASEVKDLAQETARATEDISRRVEAIQVDTTGAVTAINEISHVIGRISDFQTTIASAVEEQTATTAEMNRSVSEAANGTGEIAGSINRVAQAAANTSAGIDETQEAASDLARMSTELKALVAGFRR
ncbi:methyl-accepting chemotaxis protein [Micromonospora pattaloongensis]|uniref:Methyl-accepting chemotaxis protein n=1 Tax=Micromonospora pattaloongensis TaxID=405436 RepID=A0A1H3TA48_9ACTN|nr:methyl-accepting chemotaxis protein [Micromonospora pattaloongensis]SDZ47116.1 methyl-accepting chemotaxis protein [Micromonospora pattaloongensis]